MGFFDFFRKKRVEERGFVGAALNYNAGVGTVAPMRLSAVYRCVEVISDSVAQLPLSLYERVDGGARRWDDHPVQWLLSREPNKAMSRFTMLKTVVANMLLRGNGYVWIRRDQRGNAVSLVPVPSGLVTVEASAGIVEEVRYTVAGVGEVPARDMIHILNHTDDGIHGVSTIAYCSGALDLAAASEANARGFFSGGANVGGILTVDGPLSQKQGEDIKAKWNASFGPLGTPNGVAVLPGNMRFQTVTVNPSEAQLLETRQYSVVDICRFFGVSPVKCFDLSNSSYSTVEATQLAFLTDTLAPILEKIELELERKLLRDDERGRADVRFDTSALLRADTSARGQWMQAMFNMGALSVNEVRSEMGLAPIDGGDEHFLQVNMSTLGKMLKEGEGDGVTR